MVNYRTSSAVSSAPCDLLHTGLDRFRLNGKYCDVTVRVEEKTFQCHRVVLASLCKFFDSMLEGNFKEGSPNDTITLDGIDAVSFEIFLELIYLGREPVINQDNVYGLLRSSDFLRQQSVKKMCIEYILANASTFSSVNALEIFHLSCGMEDRLLMDTLSRYIVVYLKDFVQKDFFVQMGHDCLKLVLEAYRSSSVHFSSENFLLDAIIRWVAYNNEERRKFFPKLIETIDFDKITVDCVESYLKEYKIDCTTLAESKTGESSKNKTAPLKALILDAFSSDHDFANNENALQIPFQDSPPKITPSIHIYVKLKGDNCNERLYNVFSLKEFHDEDITEGPSCSSSHSSSNECAFKSNWVISSTFSRQEDSSDFILATLNKPELIYCLCDGKFRAYNSTDLSSDQYTELTSPGVPLSRCLTNVGVTDNGYIYLHPVDTDVNIHCYDCTANMWLPIPKPDTKVTKSGFVADDNLLYLIEGVDCSKKIYREFIQVYDRRSPRWLTLSQLPEGKSEEVRSWEYSLPSIDYYYKSPLTCIVDGNIYVYDGKTFRVFDITAKNWRNMKLKSSSCGNFTNTKWVNSPDDLKMIYHKDHLLVYAAKSSTFLSCNYKTEKFEELPLFDKSYCEVGYFEIQNVIAFKSTEV